MPSRLRWSTASCSRARAIRTGDDVGRVATTPGGDEGGHASVEEYRRFADATRGALDVAAEGRLSVAWRHDGTTETAWVLFVSANYFSMVDAPAMAGRISVATRRWAAVGRHRRAVLAPEARRGVAGGADAATQQHRRRRGGRGAGLVHGPGRPLLTGRLAAARRSRAVQHVARAARSAITGGSS